MTDPQDSAEPQQELPAGLPRRYAEYRPVDAVASAAPPTNVGGYEELLACPGHQDNRVDVVRVAIGRLATGDPTLLQNYAHVLEFGRKEP